MYMHRAKKFPDYRRDNGGWLHIWCAPPLMAGIAGGEEVNLRIGGTENRH